MVTRDNGYLVNGTCSPEPRTKNSEPEILNRELRQNVTNRDNVFIRRYNQVQKQVGTVYQIGFFPDIMYKIQW